MYHYAWDYISEPFTIDRLNKGLGKMSYNYTFLGLKMSSLCFAIIFGLTVILFLCEGMTVCSYFLKL